MSTPRASRAGIAAAWGLAVLCFASSARATYSIVAMDRETGRYGVATASCVELSVLRRVYAAVPGRGAVLTQSYLVEGDASQKLALELLADGTGASAVIEAMTEPRFDADAALRQYVVLDADGQVARFTGRGAEPFAEHRDASDATFAVGLAGNILTGDEVLEAAAKGFHAPGACDLEARLASALEAASADGLGDARCVPDDRPASAAWLYVGGLEGAEALDLAVDASPEEDPVETLQARFDDWRASHPCPVAAEPKDEAATGAGPPAADADRDRGCGCTIRERNRTSAASWLAALVLLWGRRRWPLRSS